MQRDYDSMEDRHLTLSQVCGGSGKASTWRKYLYLVERISIRCLVKGEKKEDITGREDNKQKYGEYSPGK